MLFHFLTSLIDQYSFLNVFKYLTFRTGLSVITSMVVVFIIGAPLIKIFSEKTNRFCRKNLISNNEKNQLLKNFKASIDGYTYFEN